MTLDQLLDLHGELCSASGRQSPEWLQRWHEYEAARDALEAAERRVVRYAPTSVSRAIIERFGTWLTPDERTELVAFDYQCRDRSSREVAEG